ncbi:MAG: hypothetical protein KGH71_01590 [Candidatus Micrarchaeota archaeon]|nr:hypothetical protein [Candidatus Micrarchaeota archaeon]
MPGNSTKAKETEAVRARVDNLLRSSEEKGNEAQSIKLKLESVATLERDAETFARNHSFGKAGNILEDAADTYKLLGMKGTANETYFAAAEHKATAVLRADIRNDRWSQRDEISAESIAVYLREKKEGLVEIQEIVHQARSFLETFVKSEKPAKQMTDEMRQALWRGKGLAAGVALHYITELDIRARNRTLYSAMFGEDAARFMFYAVLSDKGEAIALEAVDKFNKWLVGHYDDAIAKMTHIKHGFIENTNKLVGNLLEENKKLKSGFSPRSHQIR